MSDKLLRSQLIRVAHENPNLRAHLVPLLRSASTPTKSVVAFGDEDEAAVEGNGVRILIDHRKQSILVQEVPLPGKLPSNRQVRQVLYENSRSYRHERDHDYLLTQNLVHWAKFNSGMNFGQAESALREALDTGISKMVKPEVAAEVRKGLSWLLRSDTINYLLVPPADYKPLTVRYADGQMEVKWGAFVVYSPDSDFQQTQPYYTGWAASSPQDARKLFKMLKANPKALENVPYSKLRDFFDANKIKIRSVYSTW
jgi:hypothetical protein